MDRLLIVVHHGHSQSVGWMIARPSASLCNESATAVRRSLTIEHVKNAIARGALVLAGRVARYRLPALGLNMGAPFKPVMLHVADLPGYPHEITVPGAPADQYGFFDFDYEPPCLYRRGDRSTVERPIRVRVTDAAVTPAPVTGKHECIQKD